MTAVKVRRRPAALQPSAPQPSVHRRDCIGLLGGLVLLPACAMIGQGGGGGGDDDAAFFDARTGERLGRRSLLGRMTPAPIVLLGEVHDNTAHHRIRAALLLQWVRSVPNRPAALVFEQLDREYNEALRQAQRQQPSSRSALQAAAARDATPPPTIAELLDAARFNRQSWGWPAHLPLFEAAQASGATWIAANFSRASAQQLVREPDAAVDPALQAVVESARWSDEAQQALVRALMQGHCNALSGPAVASIARIQRLRDAALALPLLDANERRCVLLAGNGHVRRDHGVPLYLGAYENEALVVGFEEVVVLASARRLADLVGSGRAGDLGKAYDLVCLTPAGRAKDPCAAFNAASADAPASNVSKEPVGLEQGGAFTVNPAAPT